MHVDQFTGTVEGLAAELEGIADGARGFYKNLRLPNGNKQQAEILWVRRTHVANQYMIGYRSSYVQGDVVTLSTAALENRVATETQTGSRIISVTQTDQNGGGNSDDVIILSANER